MAHERLRFPAPTPPAGRGLPHALRDPLRAATLGAAVVTAVGAILPFMRIFRVGTGWIDITGFEQTGDGGFVLELAIVAGILAWADGAWNSRIVVLVAAPAALGGTSLLLLRDFYQDGIRSLADMANGGGHGGFEPGFWVAVVGALALTAMGFVRMWRLRHHLSFRIGGAGTTVVGAAGGVAGAILGFVAGSSITSLLMSGPVGQTSMFMLVAAVALAFLGAWFGAHAATSIARGLGRQ